MAESIINTCPSQWMKGDGPSAEIILSSRVRLARNLCGYPFPHQATATAREEIVDTVEQALTEAGDSNLGEVQVARLANLSALDRLVLVEKHLISPALAQSEQGTAVVLSNDEAISAMVNEEDHLRIQCLLSGLQLSEALSTAHQVDDLLEQKVAMAFDERHGYLTCCPTNLGTGIRASVMIHLPGLALTNQLPRVMSAVSQLGLAIRGFYGEGTEVVGNIYQISNQITLGLSETEIVNHLQGVTQQILDQEKAAREVLLAQSLYQVEDRVSRAYGVLLFARIMSSQEAVKLWSDVRLGVDLGILPQLKAGTLTELLVFTRPACLQYQLQQELGPFERDVQRANLIRERLQAGQKS